MWRRILSGATEPVDGRFLAWCALIAFIGGTAKAIIHRTEKTSKLDVLAAGIASSVAGTLMGSALLYLWGPDKVGIIFPAAGLAGWIGASLLDIASGYAMGRLKTEIDRTSTTTATTTLTQTVTTPTATPTAPPVVPPAIVIAATPAAEPEKHK